MYLLRPANQRGHTVTDWLDSYHTFSFGQYFDPNFMGFGNLRVINDDTVAPGKGFDTHPHDNMEIITIPLSGKLKHKDSMGNGSVIKAGDIQKMSAGTGISHSEMNPSKTASVRFLQIWIEPDSQNIEPGYQQKSYPAELITDQLKLIVSPDGREDSITIRQDAELYQCLLNEHKVVTFNIDKKRKAWIQVAAGNVSVNGQILVAGDGLAIVDEEAVVSIRGVDKQSNIIIFNLKK